MKKTLLSFLFFIACSFFIAYPQDVKSSSEKWQDGMLNGLEANDFKSAKKVVHELNQKTKSQQGEEKAITQELIRCIKNLYDARKNYQVAKKYEKAVNKKIAEYKRQAENLARPSSISPSARQQKMLQLKQKASDICDLAENKIESAIKDLNKAFKNGEAIAIELYEHCPKDAEILASVIIEMSEEFGNLVNFKSQFDNAKEIIKKEKEVQLAHQEFLKKKHRQQLEENKKIDEFINNHQELIRKAEQGDSEAMCTLGEGYQKGWGIASDFSKAVTWFSKAAEKGNPKAQYELAICYANGTGVPTNRETERLLYEQSAKQGYAPAQYNLGVCFDKGIGVTQNHKMAVYWYSKAAEQGDSTAQSNLGVKYFNGEGVEKDYLQAVYWFTKAGLQGDNIAQHNLAICYAKGYGVIPNDEKAFYWYSQSAKQGHKYDQFNLAMCYYDGKGTKCNQQKAFFWFERAAEQDFGAAQLRLGCCYYLGIGCPTNYSKSLYWLLLAAEQEIPEAIELLKKFPHDNVRKEQELLVLERRKKKEKKEAEEQLHLAEQGSPVAQFNIGCAYFMGMGVEKDIQKALNWWKLAAKQGNIDAIETLKRHNVNY